MRQGQNPFLEILLAEGNRGVRKRGGGKHFVPRMRFPTNEQLRYTTAIERARYANLETGFRDRLDRMYQAFDKKPISRDATMAFSAKFSKALYEHQVRMYLTGRRTIGRFDNTISDEERRMLHGAHARQMKFFHKFMRDRTAGEGRMKYEHRLDMYALSGYALYLRGAVAAYPILTRWKWKENPEAEHCEDCEKREKQSELLGGFTLAELNEMGFPGEGKTACRTRCRCHLEPVEGRARLNRTRPTGYYERFARKAA